MSENINKYEFRSEPKEITYFNEEPLKLDKNFSFFHNKIKFRKEITRLQLLFKEYTQISLLALGIRDSYLKEEYSDNFNIVLFTTNQNIRNATHIIDPYKNTEIKPGCFYLKARSEYILLLATDMNGLISGIDFMEEIFTQTFENYFNKKNLDEYIKITPFELSHCIK